MDEYRIRRYQEKIAYVITNMENLPKPDNLSKKKAIFYDLHTSIEACMSLLSMITKDLGIGVKDDRSNIHRIIEKRNLDSELEEKLNKANGLRNIIVHRYNTFDELIVLKSIPEVKEILFKWINIIEEILHEISDYRRN